MQDAGGLEGSNDELGVTNTQLSSCAATVPLFSSAQFQINICFPDESQGHFRGMDLSDTVVKQMYRLIE